MDKINNDLKQAMKGKQSLEVSVLRMLLTALKNKKIEIIGSEEKELSSDQMLGVIKSEAKKRKDSIASYEQGGREDLANQEKSELKILEKYLPAQMGDNEIEKIVRDAAQAAGLDSMRDFGKLMGQAMSKLKNQADGEKVSAIVKRVLSGD